MSLDHVSDSDESETSSVVGFSSFTVGKKIQVQTSGVLAKGKRSQKSRHAYTVENLVQSCLDIYL
jgi:hypothetical protein